MIGVCLRLILLLVRGAGRSHPSTGLRSLTSTTSSSTGGLSGARCCAARACTPPTSPEWPRQRDAGGFARVVGGAPRLPKGSPEQVEREELRRRNAQLEGELERTKLALDITGTAHALLAQLPESAETDPPSKK